MANRKKQPASLEEQLGIAVSNVVSGHPDGLDSKKVAETLRYLAGIYEDTDDDGPDAGGADNGHAGRRP